MELNENQQIVLSWLKEYVNREAITPMDTVFAFIKARNLSGHPKEWKLNGKEQAQVLTAFAEWELLEVEK